jgi:DNA-binding CsgD family transcriptional regulator
MVKGTNNDGVWNERGTSMRITIVPPLWGTWYFKIFLVLFIGGLAVLWYKTRIRNLTLKLRSEIEINSLLSKHNVSKRESEIINLLLAGKSNKEIEDQLYISSHTVKNHVYNIYQKLGVKNRGELVILLKTAPQKASSPSL